MLDTVAFRAFRRFQPSVLTHLPTVNLIVQYTCGKTTNVPSTASS